MCTYVKYTPFYLILRSYDYKYNVRVEGLLLANLCFISQNNVHNLKGSTRQAEVTTIPFDV